MTISLAAPSTRDYFALPATEKIGVNPNEMFSLFLHSCDTGNNSSEEGIFTSGISTNYAQAYCFKLFTIRILYGL